MKGGRGHGELVVPLHKQAETRGLVPAVLAHAGQDDEDVGRGFRRRLTRGSGGRSWRFVRPTWAIPVQPEVELCARDPKEPARTAHVVGYLLAVLHH
jgi:hypothetical protein